MYGPRWSADPVAARSEVEVRIRFGGPGDPLRRRAVRAHFHPNRLSLGREERNDVIH